MPSPVSALLSRPAVWRICVKSLRLLSCALIASVAVAYALPVYATGNCANGKTLYNKTNASNLIACSNSNCHGSGVDKNNILNAQNNPALIDQALDGPPGDPAMSGIRAALGLTLSDLDDIALWIFYAPACPVSAPDLRAVPATLAFGATTVGSTGSSIPVTITNAGSASATAIGFSNDNGTEFVVSGNTCGGATVAVGATCGFVVAFKPSAAGSRGGTLTLTYNSKTLALSAGGTGSSVASPGQLSMSSSLGFGSQAVGTTSAASSVTITNTGGTAVSVSNVSSSNPSEFAVTGWSCTTVNSGANCSVSITFKPGAAGVRTGSVSVVSTGTGSPQSISVNGTGTIPSPTATVTVVEYHNSDFDHYFITPVAAEIALLDARASPFEAWSRTGLSFNGYVNTTAPATSVAICRFFNSTFAPKSSHFYAPHGLGCEATSAGFPDWKLEDDRLFNSMLPDTNGACPAGTIPVYRLYNGGMGGAPNHRFVTSLAERQNMINRGFVAEGNGIGIGMCVPP